MACRYTYQGRTYEAHEFDDVLRAMAPMEAAKFMPSVSAVPGAPFVGRTDTWVALAIKRVIKMAADGGYDRVAFISGEQAADLFDLSKQVSEIEYTKNPSDGTFSVAVHGLDGQGLVWSKKRATAQVIEDSLGKEMLVKMEAGEGRRGPSFRGEYEHSLYGNGLKVGGQGMRTFYDQIVPSVAKDVLRKVGGGSMSTVTVSQRTGVDAWESGDLDAPPPSTRHTKQTGFDITPAMRAKASGGLPLFAAGDATDTAAISKAELDQIISRNLNNWKGVGVSQIAAVETWRDLPEEVIQSAEDMSLGLSKLEGVLHRGRVTLVRGAIKSADQAERILFHEIYGHLGLKAALDGKPRETLDALWLKMNGLAGVAKLAKKHEVAPGKTAWDRLQPYVKGTEFRDQAERRAVIMDELIAYLAQANDTTALTQFKGYLSDMKAAVVKALRRFGLNRLADRLDKAGAELDVLALVREARNSIITGKTKAGNPFVFAVGGKPLNPAFSERDVSQFSAKDDAKSAPKDPKRPLLVGRDELGRLRLEIGQRLYERLGDRAAPLLTKLQMKSASPELSRQLRVMKLQVEQAMATAATTSEAMFKLSEEDRGLLSDIIEGEVQAGVVPPAHAVVLADKISTVMTAQTDELVRLGMMSKETADQWRGHYLPRFYRSKLKQLPDPWMKAIRSALGKPSAMQGIKGASLKSRGLWETVPATDIADWEAMGWAIRDPDYEAGKSDEVRMWRDFTRGEREKMGEIRDAGFRFVMGYMRTQRDLALGKMFEGMAADKTIASKVEREGWVRVPDTTVPTTMGVKRYGKLAGMWVPNEVLSHLSQFEEADSEILTMYRKALGLWKEGKTVLNPVAHFNNIASNLSVAHFAGVSYWDVHKYAGAAREMVKQGASFKEAQDAGLFLGTISQEDFMRNMPESLQKMASIPESGSKKALSLMYSALTLGLRKHMGKAYEMEDLFFRFLIYRDARARGVNPEAAVEHAQKYIFTYDDLPKGARRIRDLALPFFSYTYKSVPMLLHTFLATPWRLAAPASVLWGMNALSYALQAGDEDEDWTEKISKYLTDSERRTEVNDTQAEERQHLPPWLKGWSALATPKAIRLWEDKVTGLPMFWDVSRIIPGGDMFDANPGTDGALPLLAPITPSHPIFSTMSAMLSNRDLFSGKDIVDLNDTSAEAAEKRMGWLWRQLAPAMALGSYHWDRALNAVAYASQKPIEWGPLQYTGFGKDGLPTQTGLAALQTIGIKLRPADLEKSAEIEEGQKQKLLRSIDTELRQMQRLHERGAVTDHQLDAAEELAETKRDRLKDGMDVDGNVLNDDGDDDE